VKVTVTSLGVKRVVVTPLSKRHLEQSIRIALGKIKP
jgi:hypothetical protein